MKKRVAQPLRETEEHEVHSGDNDNDNDLDMNVDIPPYIYPQPHLARTITRRQAAEDKARATYENAVLQEHFRAEDEAFLEAVGTFYANGHQSFREYPQEAGVDTSLAGTL